jgi:5-methylcytosine-specific restriction endonuclease McrA
LEVSTVSVVVLNASYEVLDHISWQRAVTLVVTGDAVIHEADPDREVRSARLSIPYPRVVRLVRYVFVAYRKASGIASKQGVLLRDKRTCVYCGGPADTVDHLVPQSRGGGNRWDNLAACCGPCNHRKADRTPDEAGMRLRWLPWHPDAREGVQRKVWRDLQVAAGIQG